MVKGRFSPIYDTIATDNCDLNPSKENTMTAYVISQMTVTDKGKGND